MKSVTFALSAALAAACSSPSRGPTPPVEPGAGTGAATGPGSPGAATYDRIARLDFNRRAAELALPLFWRSDADGDGALDPDELVRLWGWDGPALATLVAGGAFTPGFATLYASIATPIAPATLAALPEAERARITALRDELAQGQPTLVESDFAKGSAEDRAIVEHIERAAAIVERLYARQGGVLGMDAEIAAADTISKMVFFRNQGPWCVAPRTENQPICNALPGQPKHLSGLYPMALQADPKFCEVLARQKNGAALTGHFSVVVEGKTKGSYQAVPYAVAYRDDMEAVAKELEGAAKVITTADEQPFAAYLTAAAGAFRTNDWEAADVAWLAMGNAGSRWYLRIGPDEVYHDPCALKAGFHVTFARIDQSSTTWRQRLEPVKGEMEAALAKLAGAPYRARDVQFKLPDFIEIVLNAGNARPPHGATIGQSLPNWGKVADAGGRTVAMTNLYRDADSDAIFLAQTAALFCPATQGLVSADPAPGLMSTVLHEAAHNLGPAHDYQVKGKTDDAAFGGPLASMMEELKAQTAALYFAEWLVGKGLIARADADAAHVRDVAWAFGHVARGMYTGSGAPKAYSQLAAIQLGTLHAAGVLTWRADVTAANGTDRGCFDVDLKTWAPAVDKLAVRVLRAKARADKQDALAMKAAYVDDKGAWAALRGTIAERWLRAPRASFVYAIRR